MKTFRFKRLPLLALTLFTQLSYGADDNYGQSDRNDRRGPPPFSQLDLNGDSSITLDEFSQHRLPHGDHETVFNRIDSDGDGIITETELTSHKPPRKPRS
mgnify:CR=1 FL=1